MYCNLKGGLKGKTGSGLADKEAGWVGILNGDRKGFRGYTSSGPTMLVPGDCTNIAPAGMRFDDWDNDGKMELVDSTIVRVKSKPSDGTGLHSAVWLDGGNNAMLPPMTLFKLVDVQEPGWEFDGTAALLAACKGLFNKAPTPAGGAMLNGRLAVSREALEAWLEENHPDGFFPADEQCAAWLDMTLLPAGADSTIYPVNQRLIVVEATYMLPATSALAAASSTAEAAAAAPASHRHHSDEYSKLCDTAAALVDQDRTVYIRGIAEIVFCPRLAMEEEWRGRDHVWADWSGRGFSALREWLYVTGEAAVEGQTPVGMHERGRGGWTIADFSDHANKLLAAAGGEPLTL